MTHTNTLLQEYDKFFTLLCIFVFSYYTRIITLLQIGLCGTFLGEKIDGGCQSACACCLVIFKDLGICTLISCIVGVRRDPLFVSSLQVINTTRANMIVED